MAPRRGGGSSSSGGSVSSCPNAFTTPIEQASFANDVVFLAIFIGISIAFCMFRKKQVAGKNLIGIPYVGALFFFVLNYICSIISTLLQQCGVQDVFSFYRWQIAIVIFIYLAYWLLLVVVVYSLNTMLRQHLDRPTAILKIIPVAIIGIMAALSGTLAGIRAYLYNEQPKSLWSNEDLYDLVEAQQKLTAAYYSLYLISLLAAGGLAVNNIMSLRRTSKPTGDLIGWVIALFIAMIFWVIILIILVAWSLQNTDYTYETSIALSYLINFGQALSCIFILCIAKHASWRRPATSEPLAYQPVYAYNGTSGGQPSYPIRA